MGLHEIRHKLQKKRKGKSLEEITREAFEKYYNWQKKREYRQEKRHNPTLHRTKGAVVFCKLAVKPPLPVSFMLGLFAAKLFHF